MSKRQVNARAPSTTPLPTLQICNRNMTGWWLAAGAAHMRAAVTESLPPNAARVLEERGEHIQISCMPLEENRGHGCA